MTNELKKIEIKNWKNGDVIFAHECEENSIKKTVEEAVKQGVSLAYADLTGAWLVGAWLVGANLSSARLLGTDLSFVNLADANLSDANLAGADLADANLFSANLADANLAGAKFNKDQKTDLLKAIGIYFVENEGEK